MELTAAAVEKIFLDCLFRENEDTSSAVLAQGLTSGFGFHPERLNSHSPSIRALLEELPETFRENTGGGWSFLQACQTREGDQWGEHRNVEQLVTLGLATGDVEYLVPREMWGALPGGVPYLVVKDRSKTVA